MVSNILGDSDDDVVFGDLIFKLKDKEFSLDPIDRRDKLFIIFADETNGELSYDTGKFLYTDKQN